jgi:hypothetical protein
MRDPVGGPDNLQVFDAPLFEGAAADLEKRTPTELIDLLHRSLIPDPVFGTVDGARDAADRLEAAYRSMTDELKRVGLDLADLAIRARKAADLARGVDPETVAAAQSGPVGTVS